MRYVLHPGNITSKYDGDRHYISAMELVYLYKVKWEDCVVDTQPGYRELQGDIHLYPRYHGDYSIPPPVN